MSHQSQAKHRLAARVQFASEKVGLMVWSPLASGYLTGKYSPGGDSTGGRQTELDFPPIDRVRGEVDRGAEDRSGQAWPQTCTDCHRLAVATVRRFHRFGGRQTGRSIAENVRRLRSHSMMIWRTLMPSADCRSSIGASRSAGESNGGVLRKSRDWPVDMERGGFWPPRSFMHLKENAA